MHLETRITPARRWAAQRGLTLLEVLITLVLVALVVGVMSEGLFQVARIEQRLQGSQLPGQLERLHQIWLQESLEGLMPGAKDSEERFRGDEKSLSGVSNMLPVDGGLGPQPMRAQLRFNADDGVTEVHFSSGLVGRAQSTAVLAKWPGTRGSWRYLDNKGAWHRQWPPAMGLADALPQLIALDLGEEAGPLLLARLRVSAQSLGQKLDVDKVP
nr:prepilin-type N-terminal cleavage/methylation domain-containing protein [uncultured Roseateles sp.]